MNNKSNVAILLDAKSDWYCVMKSQKRGNTIIEVYNEEKAVVKTVIFTSCAYVKGPKIWEARDFRYGNEEEKQQFLEGLPLIIKARWHSKGLDVAEAFFNQRSMFIAKEIKDKTQQESIIVVAEKAYFGDE